MERKDGPAAWLILACSFFSLTISLGVPLSFGTIFSVLVDHFKDDYGKADIAAIGSIAYGILNLSSPIASWLYRTKGCRLVVTLGGALASVGFLLSYFATSPRILYLTYGVLTGFGFGLVYAPALSILPEYFDEYRYFATSFATVGSAVGTMFLPRVIAELVNIYSWRGALLVLSGVASHLVLFGTILKSPSKVTPLDSEVNQPRSFWTFEKTVIGDVRCYLLCLDSFCFAGSSYATFATVTALIGSRGITLEDGAWLMTALGASNIAGRLTTSYVTQLKAVSRTLLFALFSGTCSIGAYLLVVCDSRWSFGICLALFGFSYGCRISQVSGVLMDTFGVDRMANILGYYFFAGGVGALAIPPIAGFIADRSSGLANAVLFAASVNLLDSLVCFFLCVVSCRINRRNQQTDNAVVQFSNDAT